MHTYKVWLIIEKIDEEVDLYEECDVGFGSLGEYLTFDAAHELVSSIHNMFDQFQAGNDGRSQQDRDPITQRQ